MTKQPGQSGRTGQSGQHSQTLARGIRALEVLAEADRALSIDELAGALEMHRSIVYRMVRTLEDHRLITRDAAGRCAPGAGLAVLAHSVSRDLQTVALPELAAVAEELGMTSFVVVEDHGECITLGSVEPRGATATVAQHPGTRHSLEHGAPGIALLTLADQLPEEPRLAELVSEARERGYASSHDEILAGLSAVAVPIPSRRGARAALAVVYLTSGRPAEELARRLTTAAKVIGEQVG